MPVTYTLVWLILAPDVPGVVIKDQSVYFENRLTYEECRAKKETLDEFTAATNDVVASHIQCVPVPR